MARLDRLIQVLYEQRADSLDSWLETGGNLPSGEALAAEISRFLRERERNGGNQETGGPG